MSGVRGPSFWLGATALALLATGTLLGRGEWDAAGEERLPDQASADVYDGFDRPGAPVARPGEDPRWTVVSQRWRVDQQGAMVVLPRGPALAVVDLGSSDGTVRVRFARVANNTGLTFRYRDERNYWTMVAAPRYGTWNIERVVDGTSQVITNTGTTPVRNTTSIAVRMRGADLEFLVDGRTRARLRDRFFPNAQQAGLFGRGPSLGAARWAEFAANVAGDRLEPVVPQAP